MINLKTFLKTLFEKYKRIVPANSTTLEGSEILPMSLHALSWIYVLLQMFIN